MTSDPPDSQLQPRTEHCCAVDPRIARHFDTRMRELAVAGELPEMVEVSVRLLELLADVGELRPTVLELGCGSGALTVALLEQGAVAATGIDLSPESVATARRRAEEARVADRASFEVGDGAAARLAPHDWVILDRVICCYAHVDQLFGSALAAARTRIAFTVPESRGWRGLVSRLIILAENITRPLRAVSCPGYVHDVTRLEARLAAAGFANLHSGRVGRWHVAVWDRPAAPAAR